jgi:hypothetical protein
VCKTFFDPVQYRPPSRSNPLRQFASVSLQQHRFIERFPIRIARSEALHSECLPLFAATRKAPKYANKLVHRELRLLWGGLGFFFACACSSRRCFSVNIRRISRVSSRKRCGSCSAAASLQILCQRSRSSTCIAGTSPSATRIVARHRQEPLILPAFIGYDSKQVQRGSVISSQRHSADLAHFLIFSAARQTASSIQRIVPRVAPSEWTDALY